MSQINLSAETYIAEIAKELNTFFPKASSFTKPGIKSLSINIGVGKYDNKQKEEVYNNLLKLTGQKPKKIYSKKSISGFKLRAGDFVAIQNTLRGKKIYDFLLKFIYVALPRGRDFKGVKNDSFDSNYQTYTVGIPTASIFPTVGFGGSVDFGMQINITFKNKGEQNKILLNTLKLPLAK
jgi:large subunit ribosomal protein L5